LNGDENLDIADDLRKAVIELGKENGMSQERVNSLQSFIPIDGASMEQLFGEELPLGLRML
ncbi:MAG: hypothetical protein GYA55_03835, partial [SAR324 cluster bacterium]|nr:hypothetical protein [SAR324 cluster bacterium]